MTQGHPIPLSVDALMAKSREITGIGIVDDAAVEPLTVLHRSLNEDARMHADGAAAQTRKLLRMLCNRLRMLRDFARHPEIAEQEIRAPLIVYGMARSGTTKTQKVLAATGDFNWLPFWQSYNFALFTGDRAESPEPRIREAQEYCDWMDEHAPENRTGHHYSTFEPEEEIVLTESSLHEPGLMAFVDIPQYLQWYAAQDPAITFRYLRDGLKYLQWQGLAEPARKWLLKGPHYIGLIPVILSVFPDARLVFTHRSSLQTIPSACKLLHVLRGAFGTPQVDYASLIGGFAQQTIAHQAWRAEHPDAPILDLTFDDITRTPESAVAKIYAHAGMTPGPETMARVGQWELDHPQHKNGVFRYSLEEFGLTAEGLAREMAIYDGWMRARFGI